MVVVNAETLVNANSDISRTKKYTNIGCSGVLSAAFSLKRQGIDHPCKKAGCEFLLEIIDRSWNLKSFYFMDVKGNIIDITIRQTKADYRNITIVGYRG